RAARRPTPASARAEKSEATAEPARLAALESALSTLELRVKGLEEDPIRRGESFLESENAELRREGINTLRGVARSDPRTRAALRNLLHDPSSRVREQAAQVLGRLKDRESAPDM